MASAVPGTHAVVHHGTVAPADGDGDARALDRVGVLDAVRRLQRAAVHGVAVPEGEADQVHVVELGDGRNVHEGGQRRRLDGLARLGHLDRLGGHAVHRALLVVAKRQRDEKRLLVVQVHHQVAHEHQPRGGGRQVALARLVVVHARRERDIEALANDGHDGHLEVGGADADGAHGSAVHENEIVDRKRLCHGFREDGSNHHRKDADGAVVVSRLPAD